MAMDGTGNKAGGMDASGAGHGVTSELTDSAAPNEERTGAGDTKDAAPEAANRGEDRGRGVRGEETDMAMTSVAKDGDDDGKIVDLPGGNGGNRGNRKGPSNGTDEAARPLDEAGLRALLLDLRSDITELKKEQDEAPLAGEPQDEAHLYDLLAALKQDINILKTEQVDMAPPPAEPQVHDLLAELKHDIEELKAERAHPAPHDDEARLTAMLNDLKSDIRLLKAEQEHHLIPASEAHLQEMLADLKTDMKVLKAETPPLAHEHSEEHLYGMLSELKQDIRQLQTEHDLTPVPYAAAPAPVAARPKTLRYMLSGAALTLLVLGAGAGGYLFSVYQQDGTWIPFKTQPIAGPKAPFAPSPAAVEGKEANAVIPDAAPQAPPADGGLASDRPSRPAAASGNGAGRTVSGPAGAPVELKINLTGADVKPETKIVLLGIPEDAVLSSGTRTGSGEWNMTVWDTLQLTLTAPKGYSGSFPVTVALMDADGARTKRETFTVRIGAPLVAASAAASPEAAPAAGASPAAGAAKPPALATGPSLSPQELQQLIDRAHGLIDQGDIISARNVLDYAVSGGSAEAAYRLARTYDTEFLDNFKGVLEVKPDLIKARVLYHFAARKGHQAAAERLTGLKNADPAAPGG